MKDDETTGKTKWKSSSWSDEKHLSHYIVVWSIVIINIDKISLNDFFSNIKAGYYGYSSQPKFSHLI